MGKHYVNYVSITSDRLNSVFPSFFSNPKLPSIWALHSYFASDQVKAHTLLPCASYTFPRVMLVGDFLTTLSASYVISRVKVFMCNHTLILLISHSYG